MESLSATHSTRFDRSILLAFSRTAAEKALRVISVSLICETAGRDAQTVHRNFLKLRCRWKLFALSRLPDSVRMQRWISLTFLWVPGMRVNSIGLDKFPTVNRLMGVGLGPQPARKTILPQNLWSPKRGIMIVGQPHARPVAVVPAPPWCMTHDTCRKSQSCETFPMKRISSGTSRCSLPRLLHPREIISLASLSERLQEYMC